MDFAVKLWSVRGAAAAVVEIQALAPRLSCLLYDLAVPERPLNALLDWSEAAAIPGSLSAFELPQLCAVLPSMLTVFIATHTYPLIHEPEPSSQIPPASGILSGNRLPSWREIPIYIR